ncbi:hypothetical protein [Streptomyces sp. A1499]|uniref:hypothetical protein n=1 Tax=Streptomyces sp. A1499 TaxID=2563104 RepID=UPI001F11182A|nr:hypothetical protein [Streptomyces sp. A1499]
MSAPQTGLLLLPMSVTAIGVTAFAGRSGPVRGKLVVGTVAQCLGCGSLLLLRDDSALWLLVLVTATFGEVLFCDGTHAHARAVLRTSRLVILCAGVVRR